MITFIFLPTEVESLQGSHDFALEYQNARIVILTLFNSRNYVCK